MALSSEVGLRVLLCPLGSNIVIRTACCSVGILLPVYSTFKAIENQDRNDEQKWLLYWAVYGSFSVAEVFADKILYWLVSNSGRVYLLLYMLAYFLSVHFLFYNAETGFPFQFPLYYHVKFSFLVWLQLPSANGAKQLYMSHLRPFLLRHQAKLDQIEEFVYCETSKFISAHQGEIQFARRLFMKIMASANQMIRDTVHPMPRQTSRAIEGPARRIQDSQSDNED